MQPEDVLKEVQDAGLKGRGGAAFPTALKWSFLARAPGQIKYILCNCEEGDPGAYNDKGILESDPHTLLEGILLAGYATGATHGYIFIRHGHDGPIERAKEAVRQAGELGILGNSIFGSDFDFQVEVALTGDSYVAGEETALMEAIEGSRAMPRFRPPFPAQVGLFGRPTLVNNVETVYWLRDIIEKGPEWFANKGIGGKKGFHSFSVSGRVKKPGVKIAPAGITVQELIDDYLSLIHI